MRPASIYLLIDDFVCSIAECFNELCYIYKNTKNESNACDIMKINVTQQIDSNFSWSVLFLTIDMMSKCSKLKRNHQAQASGFNAMSFFFFTITFCTHNKRKNKYCVTIRSFPFLIYHSSLLNLVPRFSLLPVGENLGTRLLWTNQCR